MLSKGLRHCFQYSLALVRSKSILGRTHRTRLEQYVGSPKRDSQIGSVGVERQQKR